MNCNFTLLGRDIEGGFYDSDKTPIAPNTGKSYSKRDRKMIVRGMDLSVPVNIVAKTLGRTEYAIDCQMNRIKEVGQQAYIDESYIADVAEAINNTQGADSMNANHVISLLQTGFKTVGVTYPDSSREYTFKTHEDFAVDEFAVVMNTAGIPCVVQIASIHETPQIEAGSSIVYKWIVQKVDMTAFLAQNKKEEEFLAAYKVVLREKKKAQVIADFKEHLPQEGDMALLMDKAIKNLSE